MSFGTVLTNKKKILSNQVLTEKKYTLDTFYMYVQQMY